MKTRMLIAAALALAAAALPASPAPAAPAAGHAPGVEDPRAFVQAVYDAYRAGPGAAPADPAFAYSHRLRVLFDAYEAWAARYDDLVGSLDFDWWINAQDWELGPVEVAEEAVGRDRRTVVAHFTNGGRAEVNRFHFIRQRNRWYLDDVVNGDGHAHGWVLSELLRDRWK
jgi:hypothetical protein